ncbi:hypothetical protein K3495_g4999 [Podosphaera aphanis]|nr:hypothetical protein K3495_g4999 [Podosphaera aphanis]
MANTARTGRENHTTDVRSHSPHHKHRNNYRSRSPRAHHKSKRLAAPTPLDLPFGSRKLTKRDYDDFKYMFSLYLEIQKSKVLEDLDEIEVRGRWKSFIGKWNRGELSEGWYDPATLQKANDSSSAIFSKSQATCHVGTRQGLKSSAEHTNENTSESDDSIGPTLPEQETRSSGRRFGPRIPKLQDLQLKRETDAADEINRRDDIKHARQMERKDQKAMLDELVPRAPPGTRERQLEKKKDINEKMKSFREKSPGAAEIPESQLMGDGDGIDSFKKTKQEYERKKNERELRKEETLRARIAEREERLQEYRIKEEATMEMLKALAKQRYG